VDLLIGDATKAREKLGGFRNMISQPGKGNGSRRCGFIPEEKY
jgi:hypothetical protein